MPRKWGKADYYDDYDDYEDDYDYDYEEAEVAPASVQPAHTSEASAGNGRSFIPLQQNSIPEVGEPEADEDMWCCSVCTFDNPLDSATCDICDTPREELSETPTTTNDAAITEPKLERGSALARALFKPLPGTKSDKASPSTSSKSHVMDMYQNLGSKFASSLSLSPKIVPFKFDTPSPDEKNLAARGIRKIHPQTTTMSEEAPNGSKIGFTTTGGLKLVTPAPKVKSKMISAVPTGSMKPKSQSSARDCQSTVTNGSSAEALTTERGDVNETLKRMTINNNQKNSKSREVHDASTSTHGLPLESYVPESWMLMGEKKDQKQLLHLIVVGHVDAGKSTLMGRILHLLGRVTQKEMHRNEKESKQQGKGSFAYAFVLDEGAEERARGVTMTVAVAHFETPRLRVVLLDAPGHKDFVPNMISGASQADAAVLVVDASIGAFEAGLEGEGQGRGQTREHAQLARSLGVEQVIVAVNKLDAVNYAKERFDFIKITLQPFLKQCGFKDGAVKWVPVSAGDGQNLTSAPTEAALKAWYNGPSLVELVDSLEPPARLVAKPLRLVIAEVMKTRTLGASALGGKLECGAIQIGTKVRVMPSGEVATVKSIEQDGQLLNIARAGEGVDVGLIGIDPGMLSPGGVICHPDYPVPVAIRFEIRLLTLEIRIPILTGSQVVLHVHHARQPARVAQLVSLLDPKKGTVLRQRPRCLTANQSAIVEIVPDEPVCIERYTDFRALGRIALREGGKTIAVGIVTQILEQK